MNDNDQSTINLQEFLRGLEYPASKQKIIDYAKSKDAPQEAIDILEKIPEKDYQNPLGLLEEISKLR